MTIRINQIAVDFTLEKEKTFADLTTALRAWALGQNLAVLGILADGKALGPDDPTPLDSIGAVDVEAVPVGERDLARVAVLSRYFALLAQGLDSGDKTLVTELKDEYPGVRAALFPLLDGIGPRLAVALAALDGPWDDPAALGEPAVLAAEITEGRRRELQAPAEALGETLAKMERCAGGLSDLGAVFQRGDDREGLGRILELFTLVDDLGRRAPLALGVSGADTDGWIHFQEGLRPLLRETEGALAARDYILLTDLLEYEVLPRLAQVRDLFWNPKLDPVPGVL